MHEIHRLVLVAAMSATVCGAVGQPDQADQPGHGPDRAPAAAASTDRAGRPATAGDSGEFERFVVAGTTSPESVMVGLEVLRNGGSAADAAIATSVAQVVHAGGAWNSLAGIFMLLHRDAESGRIDSLNAGYNTVLAEDDPLSIPAAGVPSGRATFVPGFMAGIGAAHARHGRLPLADLLAPSIGIAEEGFIVSPMYAAVISRREDVLRRREETWRIFSVEGGRMLRAGDRLVQRDLARTLRDVSAFGVGCMYSGDWATALVDAVGSEGGRLSLEDLRRYEVIWSEPVRTMYRGFEVASIGLPELGGVQLVEAMNLCEAVFPGRAIDLASAEDLFAVMQVARFGYLPSGMVPVSTGDGDEPAAGEAPESGRAAFSPPRRVGKAHAARQAARFVHDDWERRLAIELAEMGRGADLDASGHSDAVVAVDQRGNIAVVVHSSNNDLWGSTGIFVGGVSIPDSACFQQHRAMLTGPGRRLPNATNPTMALRDGRPVLACGAIGSGLNESMIQNMINVLDQGLDPAGSLRRPAFLTPDWSTLLGNRPGRNAQQVTAGDFPVAMIESIRGMGQPVSEVSRVEALAYHGYWIGVGLDGTGRMRAAVSTLIAVPGAVAGE